MKPLGIKTENVSIDFGEGDSIAVVAGVWKDTVGVVQKLDYGKQTATINVEMLEERPLWKSALQRSESFNKLRRIFFLTGNSGDKI